MTKSFADILAQARRPEDTVELCLRGDLVAQFHALERELVDAPRVAASLADRSPAAVLAERITALREQMDAAKVTFHLRALPPREWSDYDATRPNKADDETDDAFRARFFGWTAGLVSRCLVDPVLTPDQVAEVVDVLSAKQWDQLADAAWLVNTGQVSVPFSAAASALTPSDAPK